MTNTAHDHNPAAGAASTWRMPAEWAPHERCLTAWPTREGLWGPYFDEAKAEYAATANAIREFEPVLMIANPGQADEVRTACSGAVEAVELAIDDSCIRDSGPPPTCSSKICGRKTASARSRGRRWMVVRVVANVAVHRVRVEGGGDKSVDA
jgi:agmatine/peptidylarginine deiminase